MSVQVDESLAGELYCSVCEKLFEEGEVCPVDGTRLMKLVAPLDPMLGRELDGRYTIVEKIGQGGMGAIYRGTQHSIEREVAIKVIHTQYMSSTETIRRFLREAKLASRLNHPNAVGVVDFGQTEDGVFYLVMELIRGRTLDEMIKAGTKFTPRRIVRIARQVCDALAAAHALEIIHRDLKPANIMLLDEHPDFVKVLDFGLAKSLATEATTMSGSGLLGTPAFLPPEVALGARVDGRADLYSLGCILYLLGAQRLPFEAASPHELVALHGTKPAPAMTGVPEPLAKVIDRMLARDPNERFQTATEAREALEDAVVRFKPDAMDTPMPVENAQPRRRSNTDLDLLLRGRVYAVSRCETPALGRGSGRGCDRGCDRERRLDRALELIRRHQVIGGRVRGTRITTFAAAAAGRGTTGAGRGATGGAPAYRRDAHATPSQSCDEASQATTAQSDTHDPALSRRRASVLTCAL